MSQGYLLEGKLDNQIQFVKDICDHCGRDLLGVVKEPVVVFKGCAHTFHFHCYNSQTETSEYCLKCIQTEKFLDFCDQEKKLNVGRKQKAEKTDET